MINIDLILKSLPILLRGTTYTLLIAAGSCAIGLMLGLVLGTIQARSQGITKNIIQVYVTLIRGTPMLMQILFLFMVLPKIGFHLSAINTAIVAIGLNSGAYISQIIRAGILSINPGQAEAAHVLGLTKLQTLRYIILPQAIRVVVPSLGNEFITLVKDSSLASTIGVAELFKEGRAISYATFDVVSILFAVGLIYLALTSMISLIMHRIEKRLQIPTHDYSGAEQ